MPKATTEEMGIEIAKFMGLKSFEDSRYGKLWPNPASDGVHEKTAFSLKYHLSWDWLMPVIEKINSTDGYNAVHIDCSTVYVHRGDADMLSYEKRCFESSILCCFQAVYDFIVWYNETIIK